MRLGLKGDLFDRLFDGVSNRVGFRFLVLKAARGALMAARISLVLLPSAELDREDPERSAVAADGLTIVIGPMATIGPIPKLALLLRLQEISAGATDSFMFLQRICPISGPFDF